MKWAYVLMLIWNLLLFAVQPVLVGLYHVSEEASHLAMIILWLHGGLGILMWPAAFTLPQALKGAGDTSYVMIAAVASMWTFRILTGFLFAKYLGQGVLGIWYAMFIDWVLRVSFFVPRFMGHKWETMGVQ